MSIGMLIHKTITMYIHKKYSYVILRIIGFWSYTTHVTLHKKLWFECEGILTLINIVALITLSDTWENKK